RHQVSFYVIDGFCEGSQKLIEVLLVQKHFMTVVTVVIKTLLALGDCNKVITATCGTNIKKVSPSFPCFYTFAEQALILRVSIIFVFVRHSFVVLSEKKLLLQTKLIKLMKYPN